MLKMKAALHNLGCKVNAYETEAMQELLSQAGCEIVPFGPGADVYVINTCTVTNIADRKSRQLLHRAKKMNPQAIVIAAGCYVQTGQKTIEDDAAVDILLGNDRKHRIVRILEDFLNEREKGTLDGPLCDVTDISGSRNYEKIAISKTADRVRANIKITDGCNQFCSYCLIPYARGRVRSRTQEDILQEIRTLAIAGYPEVVLTGIHLSSYGSDFSEERRGEKTPALLTLIGSVSEIPGIKRIRLGSLEPRIITEEFAEGLKSIPQLCPHFHLSLQSGCDATLRRMNRHYTASEYAEKCRLLRDAFGDPALTTDVITGFPGETEAEYEASRTFIDQIGFYETHIFKYSRRDGTRAAMMPDQVSESVKEMRSTDLIRLGARHTDEYERRMYGKKLEVLLEEEKVIEGKAYLTGHSREYIPAAVPAGKNRPGEIVSVPVTAHLQKHLLH